MAPAWAVLSLGCNAHKKKPRPPNTFDAGTSASVSLPINRVASVPQWRGIGRHSGARRFDGLCDRLVQARVMSASAPVLQKRHRAEDAKNAQEKPDPCTRPAEAVARPPDPHFMPELASIASRKVWTTPTYQPLPLNGTRCPLSPNPGNSRLKHGEYLQWRLRLGWYLAYNESCLVALMPPAEAHGPLTG